MVTAQMHMHSIRANFLPSTNDACDCRRKFRIASLDKAMPVIAARERFAGWTSFMAVALAGDELLDFLGSANHPSVVPVNAPLVQYLQSKIAP